MSDIHLNFLDDKKIEKWASYVGRAVPDAQGILITGDISEAPQLSQHLKALYQFSGKLPIWFVLGNHDVWKSGVATVQDEMKLLHQANPNITWLGDADVIQIADKAALVGGDGWYDAMLGDWQNSHFRMRDWDLIFDFMPVMHSKAGVVAVARKFAYASVVYLEKRISEAVALGNETVVILTHVPPFEEASQHRGRVCDRFTQPWYTSKAMGEMILQKAAENPDKKFVVFCGHTHSKCHVQPAHNVAVFVMGADYGNPSFTTIQLG